MAAVKDNLARKQIFIPANVPEEEIVLRVAAYCRVSTDSDDQINSFVAQNSHYMEMITAHDRWELVDIYADEGITGTSAKKRKDFQRLLADCRNGRIDKVLVKSISRFARNTTECLEAVRELKSLGISIFFEEHNIDTRMVSSEMLTAVIASCTQAESESISRNMRWSVQRRMESGTFNTCRAATGFRLSEDGLRIAPEEAPVIYGIFADYLQGKNSREIAERLNAENALGRVWNRQTIDYMLKNERYAGNAFAYSAQSDGVVFFEEFRKVAAGLDRTRNVDLISTTEAARRKLEDILIRETDGELDQMTSEVAATSFDECVRMEHIDLVKENRGLSERAETRESQVIQLLARDHVNKLRWMRLLLLAARYWWLLGFGILFAVASAISDSVILRGFSTVPILIQLGQFAADKFVDDRGLRFRVYDKALAYVKCRYANKISAKVEAAGYASDKDAVVDYCVAHTPVFDRLKR